MGKVVSPHLEKENCKTLDNFNPTIFFAVNWFIVYDKLGNGCKVDPVRLESKLKWSPALYDKFPNGTVVVRKKIFSEIIVVTLVKKRC